MSLSLLFGEEETSRLNYVFSTSLAPADLSGVLACGDTDRLAVYDKEALVHIVVYSAVEAAVHCVILQHVCHVVYGEKVVDCNNLDVVTLGGSAENETTDAAETVNTNLCHIT